MAIRQYNLTITATPQRLSSVLTADPAVGGSRDEALLELQLTATADCFIGHAAVTTSVYARKIFADVAGGGPVQLGPYDMGRVKLSDLYVVGTSGTLNIFAVPF